MKPLVRNIAAVLVGFIVGSLVNIGLVNMGPLIVPLPEGADVSDMESLRESMQLFTPANFVFPFLGHAFGTLSGAFLAARLSVNHHMIFAICIGLLFLAGGISMVVMMGGPLWFICCDLLFAYIPMGYLGAKLAGK
ncbi:MAG: hypothetical protein P8L44_12495 [Opitutales bacterium]|jgi:hypothetical protein|nr:hypothetical protein [Opitutales bacterium]